MPDGYIQPGAFTVDGGAESMLRLLGLAPPPDAVFAANDLMAIGAIMACKSRGLQVPGDVAVMGFDDIAMGRLISPSLTTVTQFQNQLGQRAATMLFERINRNMQSEGRCVEMPFQIVVREST
jgi:LacI family transcriptional regulator